MYKTITITFKNGSTCILEAEKEDWDDYSYDGKALIVKKGGAWVDIYNMDCIFSVVVK